jgi:type IV pilus assembly protein PilN
VHFYFEDRISGQQARNQYLKTEIAALDRQIKEIDEIEKTKADLLARMEIIQRLQKSRPEIVRLFDELVTAMPEGVYLTKLEQSERTVTLEGRAQSNARVSAFMRRIEGSQSIGQPRLMLIENKDKTGTGLSHFRLSFNQSSPEPETPVTKPAKPARKPARKA